MPKPLHYFVGFVLIACLAERAQDRSVRLAPVSIDRRMAFVVGNSAYPDAPLKNPLNDAQDITAQLTRLGFHVTLRQNLAKRDFNQQFNQFTQQLRSSDLALFYFSGHGMQLKNENYLIPVDVKISSPADLEFDAYSASQVRMKLQETGARIRVIILDACRTNPLFRGGGAGLAAMANAPEGSLIALSAAENQPAADNPGERNGLFTKYLLAELKQPGQTLKEMFEKVQADVYRASAKTQLPAIYDTIVGRVVLSNDSPPAAAPVPEPSRPAPPATGASPKSPGQKQVNGKDGLTYVWIPPGNFMMGCSPGDTNCRDNEKPHPVQIESGFWIGQTEVTQAAYQRVTGKNDSEFHGDNLPAESVTQAEATAYCQAVQMRLPTEEQWEYAARAGSTAARYGPLDQIAWYSANSGKKTHEVAQKLPNQFGLYDMLGNVTEWVSQKDYLRGGSWELLPQFVRVSIRHWDAIAKNNGGFRCVGDSLPPSN